MRRILAVILNRFDRTPKQFESGVLKKMSARKHLGNILNKFSRDNRGNFAIITAIALMPIVAAVGAGIDYSRLSSQMSNFQQAADAAVLAAAKQRSSMTEGELLKYARKIFDANLSNTNGIVVTFKLDEDSKDHKLTLNTNGYLETSFLGAVGISEMNFDVLSQVGLPGNGLEVALVLDNTDSMRNDGKIGDLKIAANNFVNLLMPGKNNKEKTLKISVVPFGNYVNVGKRYRNKKWITVAEDYSEKRTYRPVTRKYNCVTKTHTRTYEGKTTTRTYESCKKEYGPEKTYTKNYTWQGCVGSREYPRNLIDIEYNKEKVTGLLGQSCTKEVLPLTWHKQKILTSIKHLNTRGETYIPAGVTWGRRVLSKHVPFTGGAKRKDIVDEKVKQVLILMTDGQNTKSKNPGNPSHSSRNLVEANLWTKEACDNVKRDKIELYTVTFGEDLDKDTKKLMLACASSPNHYFDATSGKALDTSFKHIANSIRTVYLSK